MKTPISFITILILSASLMSVSANAEGKVSTHSKGGVKVIEYDKNATIVYGCPGDRDLRTLKTSSRLASPGKDQSSDKKNILIYDCRDSQGRRQIPRSRKREAVIIRHSTDGTVSYLDENGKIRTLKTSTRLAGSGKTPAKNILIYDPYKKKHSSSGISSHNSGVRLYPGTTSITITGGSSDGTITIGGQTIIQNNQIILK